MWPQSSSSLDVSFDFTSLGLIGSLNDFAILFDTPSAQAVWFRNDGQIALQNPGSGFFLNGETFRVRIHIDFTLNRWSLYRDGVLLDELYIEPEDYVRSIRFSYGHVLPAPLVPDSSGVAIDNILVVVPEPGGLFALGVGAGLLMAWIRRMKIGTLRQAQRSEHEGNEV